MGRATGRVVIGMDPHKRSATIEVIDARERVLTHGRYGTDTDGYQTMLAAGRRFSDRVWAVEGCAGIGRHIATGRRGRLGQRHPGLGEHPPTGLCHEPEHHTLRGRHPYVDEHLVPAEVPHSAPAERGRYPLRSGRTEQPTGRDQRGRQPLDVPAG